MWRIYGRASSSNQRALNPVAGTVLQLNFIKATNLCRNWPDWIWDEIAKIRKRQ